MNNIKILFVSVLSLLLSGCSGLFEKDNTPTPAPLVKFQQTAKINTLWHAHASSGVNGDYLKMAPTITPTMIIAAGYKGGVTAIDKTSGRQLWKTETKSAITTGPAASAESIFIGTLDGNVIALQQTTGKEIWRTTLSSEVLATPTAANNLVLVKTIDGKLSALSQQDGHKIWEYQQVEPTLILRGASAPQVSGDSVLVGFANGNLVKLSLRDGSPLWQQTIGIPSGSFAIQRMVDIDANPTIFDNNIYAATYQGRIAALALSSGKIAWTHDISSYTGLAVDTSGIYISDAKSHLWAFDPKNGTVAWRQLQLEARYITGPALINNYLVVGDEQGYLHWMSKQDGHFVARVKVGSSILAAPLVDNNVLYVITRGGDLAAYTVTN